MAADYTACSSPTRPTVPSRGGQLLDGAVDEPVVGPLPSLLAGSVLIVSALSRTGRVRLMAFALGGYITAAYWFTSSVSFANPAVAIARMLSDTFAGIAPASVPLFLAAQTAGAAVGYVLAALSPPPRPPPARRETVNGT